MWWKMGWVPVGAMLLALLFSAACSRQASLSRATAPGASGPQQPPFPRLARARGWSPTGSLLPTGIPAGTVIAVRITSALSSASSQAGDSFRAILDAPVTVNGEILAPRGAVVMGKVMTARSSAGVNDPGYLRLKLTTISIRGKELLLQTSSLFAKANSYEEPAAAEAAATLRGAVAHEAGPLEAEKRDIEFAAGHLFSFRLTEPLPLQAAVAALPSQ